MAVPGDVVLLHTNPSRWLGQGTCVSSSHWKGWDCDGHGSHQGVAQRFIPAQGAAQNSRAASSVEAPEDKADSYCSRALEVSSPKLASPIQVVLLVSWSELIRATRLDNDMDVFIQPLSTTVVSFLMLLLDALACYFWVMMVLDL